MAVPGPARTLALVVEYDGSRFFGMQRQSTLPTVAAELERVLATLLGEPVTIVAAGRTDARVHATGQVVSVNTTSGYDINRLPIAASALLRSSSIAVVRASERAPGFSARHDALARTYRYRLLNRVAPSPLLARRAFHVRKPLDVDAMRAGARSLIGEHDFAAFCATPPATGGTTRTVQAIAVERSGETIDIRVSADSFLHQMVRIVAGTLVDVGRGKIAPAEVAGILASKDRRHAGFTAPAHGLYLERVDYAEPV
jgi:tRNA pseudouridine38-40 synthase